MCEYEERKESDRQEEEEGKRKQAAALTTANKEKQAAEEAARTQQIAAESAQAAAQHAQAALARATKSQTELLQDFDKKQAAERKEFLRKIENLTESNNSLKKENDAIQRKADKAEEARVCMLCFDNPRSVYFAPCGHAVVCEDCADRVGESCCSCKQPIRERMRMYLTEMVSDEVVQGAEVGTGA